MKRILLAILLLTLAAPQFALAAEELRPSAVEAKPDQAPLPKAAEKPEPVKEVKIGSVNLPLVGEKSAAGVKAMTTLKEMYEKFQATMKKKEQELEKLRAALQSRDLAPDKRAAKEKQMQKKFGEYQKYGQNAQQEFAKKQAELSKNIKEEIDKMAADYGRKHGFGVILNKEGLIYSDDKTRIEDLTEEILKLANRTDKK